MTTNSLAQAIVYMRYVNVFSIQKAKINTDRSSENRNKIRKKKVKIVSLLPLLLSAVRHFSLNYRFAINQDSMAIVAHAQSTIHFCIPSAGTQ